MDLFRLNAKALIAALVSFLSAVAVALPGDVDLGSLTPAQWLTAVVAGVVSLNVVWATSNKPAPAQPRPLPSPTGPITPAPAASKHEA